MKHGQNNQDITSCPRFYTKVCKSIQRCESVKRDAKMFRERFENHCTQNPKHIIIAWMKKNNFIANKASLVVSFGRWNVFYQILLQCKMFIQTFYLFCSIFMLKKIEISLHVIQRCKHLWPTPHAFKICSWHSKKIMLVMWCGIRDEMCVDHPHWLHCLSANFLDFIIHVWGAMWLCATTSNDNWHHSFTSFFFCLVLFVANRAW